MADLVTGAEVTAAWPGFANLAAGEQAALLTAASRAIELRCRRVFEQATLTELLSGSNFPRLFLRRPPVASITSITVNGTALDNTGGNAWTFDPETGEILRGNGQGDPYFAPWWPVGYRNIQVVYVGGYATIPADVKRAAIITVRAIGESTAAVGVMKSESIGDYSYTLADASPGTLPPAAEMLLRRYILP